MQASNKLSSIEPADRVTIQGELKTLFTLLVTTSAEVEALENALEPIAHGGGVAGCGEQSPVPPQPAVIESIRGLISSVESYNQRLSNIRLRLAL
jgi:hypothetical protein